VTKARNHGPGKAQRLHFGRQRLGILASSLDRTKPSPVPRYSACGNNFGKLPSPISLAHARKKDGITSFDSIHVACRAHSSSSSCSSGRNHSKVIHMLDISDRNVPHVENGIHADNALLDSHLPEGDARSCFAITRLGQHQEVLFHTGNSFRHVISL
jgi:hypothetical protein